MKKTEGGSGGKRGHSNMTHWDKTEQIKRESDRLRRVNDRLAVEQGWFDLMCDEARASFGDDDEI